MWVREQAVKVLGKVSGRGNVDVIQVYMYECMFVCVRVCAVCVCICFYMYLRMCILRSNS